MRNAYFRGLRMRLLRGGVAPKHVNRTLKELRHHFSDLERKALSEGLSARDAAAQAADRLGDQQLLIQEALARPELKSWAHRWPWGIYGVLPVVALALVVIGSIVGVVSLLELLEENSGLSPAAFANAVFGQRWARTLIEAWRLCMVYALPFAFSGLICVFAARRVAALIWPTIGVFLILLLGFSYDLTVIPPAGPDELATLSAGIGIGTDRFLSVRVFRLLIPLVLVLGPYYWWRGRQHGGMST